MRPPAPSTTTSWSAATTVIEGTVVGYLRGSDELYELRPAAVCRGPECTEDFSLEDIQLEILGTRRGVHLGHESQRQERYRVQVYGGWMEDSFFAIQTNEYLDPEDYGLTTVLSYAIGFSPGTNPDLDAAMTATWNGFMRGVDIDDWPDRGDVISGRCDHRGRVGRHRHDGRRVVHQRAESAGGSAART